MIASLWRWGPVAVQTAAIFTLSSIFFVGKMSVLFATDGSYFFAHSPAPATGGM